MRIIRFASGLEAATNENEGGFFFKQYLSHGRTRWSRLADNSETPIFRSPQQFRNWISRHKYNGFNNQHMVSHSGWDI